MKWLYMQPSVHGVSVRLVQILITSAVISVLAFVAQL